MPSPSFDPPAAARFSAVRLFQGAAAGMLFAALAGCPPTPAGTGLGTNAATPATTASADGEGDAALGAVEILRRSAAVYRNAPRYEDQGQLHVRFTHAGAPHDRILAPASLVLERPARLRLRYNSVTLLCDGKQVAAAVEQLPEQVLVRPAPKELSLQVIDQDPILQAYLGGSESLARKLLESFFFDSAPLLARLGERAKRLPSAVFEEHPCYRVEVLDGPTRLVYWIDQKDFLIRRLELPSQDWRDLYDPEKQMQDLGVFLELHQARIPEKIAPEQFEAKIPPQSKTVRKFLDRQRPLSPHPLLGKPCPLLLLTAADGSKQGPEQWKGEPTVLAAWATWCNLCKQALPQVAQAQKTLGANAAVRFRGVNVDEASVTPEQVKAAYEALRVPFEDLLDADQTFRKSFSVEYLPVVLVLDAEGIVQAVEVGHNDQVWAALPERINALRAGKQLFQETLNRHKQDVALYEQALLAANVDDTASVPGAAVSDQTPAAASEPQKLGWKALWTCNDVPTPGNVIVLPVAGGQRLLVQSGVNQAAELDLAGKLLRKIDLATPQGALVTSLRATVVGGKTLLAGYAPGQGRVFVFDGEGKLVLDHGGPAAASEMVSRAEWMPQPSGDPLLVLAGYRGYGAQAITIGGERRWVYRKSEDVLDLAFVPQLRGGEMLFTNSKGAAALLDREGRQTAEFFVGKSPARPLGRLMQFIASADLAGDGTPRWAGIARGEERQNILVGVSSAGKEEWDVDLAPGDHLEPIPPMLPVRLGNGGAWLAPAPNGTLQFVSADGKLLDRIALGATICGLTTLESAGKAWVVVATHVKHENYRLTAYEVF